VAALARAFNRWGAIPELACRPSVRAIRRCDAQFTRHHSLAAHAISSFARRYRSIALSPLTGAVAVVVVIARGTVVFAALPSPLPRALAVARVSLSVCALRCVVSCRCCILPVRTHLLQSSRFAMLRGRRGAHGIYLRALVNGSVPRPVCAMARAPSEKLALGASSESAMLVACPDIWHACARIGATITAAAFDALESDALYPKVAAMRAVAVHHLKALTPAEQAVVYGVAAWTLPAAAAAAAGAANGAATAQPAEAAPTPVARFIGELSAATPLEPHPPIMAPLARLLASMVLRRPVWQWLRVDGECKREGKLEAAAASGVAIGAHLQLVMPLAADASKFGSVSSSLSADARAVRRRRRRRRAMSSPTPSLLPLTRRAKRRLRRRPRRRQ
jgi:hypothetical protein